MGKTEYNHYIIFHQEKCHTFLSGKNCFICTSHFITQCTSSAQAAITNYHRLKDLNTNNLFSHSYGAENLKPGYEHRPSLSEGSFLACQRPPSSCFLMGQRRDRKFSDVSSCKDTNATTKALPSRFHLNLTISQRPHLQMSLHWELLFQHTNFTGTRFCPQYTTQYLKTNIQQLTFK